MDALTQDQIIKLRALEAAVMALKDRITQSKSSDTDVIRYAKVFEQYLNS